MLTQVQFPLEPFNTFVKDGLAGQKIQKILKAIQPEAGCFTEQHGHRGGRFNVNLKDASGVPMFFNAHVEAHGKKWA